MRVSPSSRATDLQHQCLRIFFRQLLYNVVHLGAWISPLRPKVNQRHSVEVRGEEGLEVVGRFDGVEVRHEWTNESPAATKPTMSQ